MDKLIHSFSYGLFFWMVIVLVVIIFLLGKFAWKPIVDALDEREKGIASALEARLFCPPYSRRTRSDA